MSHELEYENMAWANTVPWHGLGVELKPTDPAKVWQKAANLDWKILKQPMFTSLPNGENLNVLGKREGEMGVLVRDHGTGEFDASDVFGPVGPEWVPVQNDQVFDFMHTWCEKGDMQMETCGALKNGTEIWALAKYAKEFELVKGDPAKGYLLFHSPHIQGKATTVRNCVTRVVCNNTLSVALKEGNNGLVRMPHITVFDNDVQDQVATALGLATEQNKHLVEIATFLSKKKAPAEAVQEYLCRIYQPKTLAERKQANDNSPLMDTFNPSTENAWEAIQFSPGHNLASAKGNWWGAFNGVTYAEDHMRISHSDQSNILHSTWFGSGARRKAQALDLAMEYAKAV
tara:strand:- start:881 stop:1912 length:1032 start_codon:yes stop_codon:yes gene_type:complete